MIFFFDQFSYFIIFHSIHLFYFIIHLLKFYTSLYLYLNLPIYFVLYQYIILVTILLLYATLPQPPISINPTHNYFDPFPYFHSFLIVGVYFI